MEVNNIIERSEQTFGDLPPPTPYPGYIDLSEFEMDFYTQFQSLFSGNPPGISTLEGKTQLQQIITMLHNMAKYCQGSPWAAAEQQLENAFSAYSSDPSSANLSALQNAASYFAEAPGEPANNPPIISPSDAEACIQGMLKDFLEFVQTNSNWPQNPSSPEFAEIQNLMRLLVDTLQMNPAAEGNYQGNFWKDLISYQDPSGKQWGVLPDGQTFWNVLYQYVDPTSSGPLPSQADLEAVLQALINDL